ncbi:biofilm development regulator YmgB/AriR family protein [Pantoea sp. 1.19]|uniref:biofilm development regulator YmgB/AriR family protein n=1 Tax=Pantoea sp. 1.19 TaxID=1925589 RepID=UPI000948C067|nr:biofilm development regulator YmgB/AriR family protein [Pantoea sp. 1.19]
MQPDSPQQLQAIAALLHSPDTGHRSETDTLGAIVIHILQAGQQVNNQAIICHLLQNMATESDVVQLDIYRSALEFVVHRTLDDRPG